MYSEGAIFWMPVVPLFNIVHNTHTMWCNAVSMIISVHNILHIAVYITLYNTAYKMVHRCRSDSIVTSRLRLDVTWSSMFNLWFISFNKLLYHVYHIVYNKVIYRFTWTPLYSTQWTNPAVALFEERREREIGKGGREG